MGEMGWQWLMFSKHLQELNFHRLGGVVSEMGFDGVDLTVRPGGHIDPSQVSEKLPEAVRVLKGYGLSLTMVTTNFTDAKEPEVEKVFAYAAEQGVVFIKLGYWRYRDFGTLRERLDTARRQLEGIARIAERYQICAVVHSHSGDHLTASPFLLAELLADFDPRFVAAYVDAGHITVEGGLRGWQQGLEALAGKIRVVACKDFGWFQGGGRWTVKVVPVGSGLVAWREFFACLHKMGFDGPLSLHSEYQGKGSWRDLTLKERLVQTREDLAFLKGIAEEVLRGKSSSPPGK